MFTMKFCQPNNRLTDKGDKYYNLHMDCQAEVTQHQKKTKRAEENDEDGDEVENRKK